jgi:hypothetical protein
MWPTSAHGNAFHSAFPSLDGIMMQQFFTAMHNWGHLVMKCCAKTTLSHDNLRDIPACYLPKTRAPVHIISKHLLYMEYASYDGQYPTEYCSNCLAFLALFLVYVRDYGIIL